MAKKKATEIASEILAPFLEQEGYELYHTEFIKEGGDWFLRVYIDKQQDSGSDATNGEDPAGGSYISTDDCEKVSRYLSDKLDETDPITQNYYLEVSSPGMDRPLIEAWHYTRAIGKVVDIKLYKAVDGTKNITGILKAADDDTAEIVTDAGKEYKLDMTEIAKAKLAVVL